MDIPRKRTNENKVERRVAKGLKEQARILSGQHGVERSPIIPATGKAQGKEESVISD